MSDKIPARVPRSKEELTKELLAIEHVSEEQKKQDLQTGIFLVSKAEPFLGSVMQCMNIMYSHMLPTAGIKFNNDLKRWDMLINPFYFCKCLSKEQRTAVLLHEVYHIIHKHPFRVPSLPPEKMRLMNRAMDMAINQFIKNIPKGCPECPPKGLHVACSNPMCCGYGVDVADYAKQLPNGTIEKWPEHKTCEFYYERFLELLSDEENDEDNDGEGISSSSKGKGKGKGKSGGGNGKSSLKSSQDTIDVHDWDNSAEEKDILDATEDLMKRAMIKQNLSYSDLPGSVRDMLDRIDKRRAELNYKALILLAMKASLPSNTRKHTWTRKSRRFGNKSPGMINGSRPELEIFIDTSGSISIEEASQFLDIVDEFLKVGARTCNLNFFHTENYYTKKYKMGDRPKPEDFKMGGTDLTASFKILTSKKPDLSIFLTDGEYGDVNVEGMVGYNEKVPTTIFIISKDGREKHPFADRDWSKTVKIPT